MVEKKRENRSSPVSKETMSRRCVDASMIRSSASSISATTKFAISSSIDRYELFARFATYAPRMFALSNNRLLRMVHG